MVLEEDEDGPQRERRQQRTNVLTAGLHKAAAKGDWAAVQRSLVPSLLDPLGLVYHMLGFNAAHVMHAHNDVRTPAQSAAGLVRLTSAAVHLGALERGGLGVTRDTQHATRQDVQRCKSCESLRFGTA